MTTQEQPMTKTEAIAYVRRAREGLRWIEQTLRDNDADALSEACGEVEGAVAALRDATDPDYGRGLRGIAEPGYVHRDDADGGEELDETAHELDGPVPTVDALSLTTDGRAIRVTIQDSTEGIRTLLGAREIDCLILDDVRVYYDANGATDERPANATGTRIVETLAGERLALHSGAPLVGPLLIAGRPTLHESTLDTIASVVPTFDFAGRW
jgi:hypothetical protein